MFHSLSIFLHPPKHYSDVTWTPSCLNSPATYLFVQNLFQANIIELIKTPHYWSSVLGIHWSPVDSPHKWPIMQKVLACYDIIRLHKTWGANHRDHFVYAPSQWETTLQCNASLIGLAHIQNKSLLPMLSPPRVAASTSLLCHRSRY